MERGPATSWLLVGCLVWEAPGIPSLWGRSSSPLLSRDSRGNSGPSLPAACPPAQLPHRPGPLPRGHPGDGGLWGSAEREGLAVLSTDPLRGSCLPTQAPPSTRPSRCRPFAVITLRTELTRRVVKKINESLHSTAENRCHPSQFSDPLPSLCRRLSLWESSFLQGTSRSDLSPCGPAGPVATGLCPDSWGASEQQAPGACRQPSEIAFGALRPRGTVDPGTAAHGNAQCFTSSCLASDRPGSSLWKAQTRTSRSWAPAEGLPQPECPPMTRIRLAGSEGHLPGASLKASRCQLCIRAAEGSGGSWFCRWLLRTRPRVAGRGGAPGRASQAAGPQAPLLLRGRWQ